MHRNVANSARNAKRLTITTAKGTINRGKYTLPNNPALFTGPVDMV